MTLHNTVETLKKAGVGSVIGIVVLIILIIIFQVGVFVKNIIFPPKIEPPTLAYDVLPALAFPKDAVSSDLTYTVNTDTGELPAFPDRLNIYPIVQDEPNFLNLDKAKAKAASLGFVAQDGSPVLEIPLGGSKYEWDEQGGLNRKIIFDIVTFDYTMNSDYLSSLTVLAAQHLNNQETAIATAKSFLETIELYPEDIDLAKTQTPDKAVAYNTYPQIFSIQGGALAPATSLSNAQVIRVDLYQKDIEYQLNTGIPEAAGFQLLDMKLPIVYPHPPHSTMSFWIASGSNAPQVVSSNYVHQTLVPADQLEQDGTYPIKSAEEAFEELKNGDGYIAAYSGTDTSVLINNVYLAYYLGEDRQKYLMPVIVFEGDGGFMGYVSAVKKEWVE